MESGKTLGQPKGSLGVPRCDGREDEFRHLVKPGVSRTVIEKFSGVSRSTLHTIVATRGLELSR